MKKILLIITLACIMLHSVAFAEVFTKEKTEGMGECVYVAGSSDWYPVEYYDSEDKAFKGIVPQLLDKISDKTGIDFVYINGDKTDRLLMGENLQVEIVSSAKADYGKYDFKDYAELLKYEEAGNTISVALGFTNLASDELIESVKTAVDEISAEEKNGVIFSCIGQERQTDYRWVAGFVLLCVILAIISIVQVVKIKRIRKEHLSERMTDSQTGMGNLLYFKHHFKYTIGDVARNLYYIAYVSLDGSYIKAYYGEGVFENILKHTALVLSEYVSDREITARIDDSAFAIAFQSANETEATERLNSIARRLNEVEEGKEINDRLLFHLAVYNLNITDKNCDMVLFNLKKNCNRLQGGEKQIVFCDTHSMNRVQEEKKITESILNGLRKSEFKMYLQFIVDNKNKKIVSAEALSRWESPTKGLIAPGKYIENMESAGIISRHDFYMFDLVCRQLEAWQGTEFGNISISCNFTRITLSEENFAERLKMISDSYFFDKSKLAIEITEDAIEKNRETAMKNVAKCKELGFRIYLDDLGSGYTTLENLCDYPIDIVKIDRDILIKADTEKGKELFEGIIALAHNLNIKVICEGVETEEQNSLVNKSECDFVQGWYYSKAFPVEECEGFIKTRI